MDESKLSIQSYVGREGLSSFFGDWEDLMTRIRKQCFYHHPRWFKAFLGKTDEDDENIVFVCAYRGATLVAVFPTTWSRRKGGGMLEVSLPFGEELYLADWAMADEEDAAALYTLYREHLSEVIGEPWDLFKVQDVLEDGCLASAMVECGRFSQTVYPEKLCAEVPIENYEEAIKNLKKKFRGNLNNARSKLERAGNTQYSVFRAPDEIGLAFQEFVDLEMKGWKGSPDKPREKYPRPSAIGLKAKKLRFYESAVRYFSEIGCAEISMLKLDDQTIGAQICLLLNETSYLVKVAYDESAGRFSPGQLLIDHAYQRYAEEGKIKRYNLITDYAWFSGWNPEYRHYLVMRDFNSTIKGAVACLRSKVGLRARKNKMLKTSAIAVS